MMRRISLVLSVVVALTSLGLMAAPAVAAPAPPGAPKLTVSPHTGLADGQLVTAKASGFPANYGLGVLACLKGSFDASTCDQSTLAIVSTDATGAFRTQLYLQRILAIGGGTVDCAPGACELVAATDPGFAQAAAARLSFDPSIPPLPAPVISATIDASGTVHAPAGGAVVSGTLTCNRPISLFVSGLLKQFYGRFVFSAFFGGYVQCVGGTVTWAFHVEPQNGLFAAGRAAVNIDVSGTAGGVPVDVVATRSIRLVAG